MRIDAEIHPPSLGETPALARKAEEYGFDCVWTSEIKHDPFLQLALAASSTKSVGLGTSVALAFTKSPTSLAYIAWDLQDLSNGRFILGVGSQVKGHIERRFGVKWDKPAPKMRETVEALRAVWGSWQNGTKLDFRGEFFRLDLMTPFFSPDPLTHPRIPVYVAGVNQSMCRAAGEVADGLHVHPLHTVRYLKEVIVPALFAGLRKRNKKRADFDVTTSAFAAVGRDEKEIRSVRNHYRGQIAFYASTRTYRKVMELHGWGDICERLHELSLREEWKRMAAEVTDDVLDEFVIEGTWGEIGPALRARYEGLADRVRLYRPFDGRDEWKSLPEAFKP